MVKKQASEYNGYIDYKSWNEVGKTLLGVKEGIYMHKEIQVEKGPLKRAKLTISYILMFLLVA